MLGAGTAQAAPLEAPALHLTADSSGAVPVQGLHLTFGADPRTQMTVSWITDRPVSKPVVRYGTLEHGFGSSAKARTATYVDGTSSRTVYVHHAALNKLTPDTDYLYLATHEGATPDSGTFRTAPRGRKPITFTSFGDQSAPQVTWAANGTVGLDANSTPATKDIVTGIEQVAPLFHLLNGDLCYANLDVDRVRTWNNFFTNNTRSGPLPPPGRLRPATTRSRRPTARSDSAPTRPTSPSRPPRPTPNSRACTTRSRPARSGSSCCRTTTTASRTAATSTSAATPADANSPSWRKS
ncbi:fibronectin type III domain-containing protein [Streptomyces sp. L7]